MPEKTKRNKDFEKAAEKQAAESRETVVEDTLSRDQQEKSYYYDDGYGYEIYNPEEDESDQDN